MSSIPSSYWQDTAMSLPLSTAIPSVVDVAIIGGGIMGVSACYWLAKQGIDVALLEKTLPAYGATGRNGGFVVAGPAQPYHKVKKHLGSENARAILQLTCDNQKLLRTFLTEENISCDYREPGALRLALTEAELESFDNEVKALESDDFPITLLSRDEVQAYIKTPLSSEVIGGQFLPGQGMVHSAKLVQGILKAAQRYGAQAYQAEVFQITTTEGSLLLNTSQGTIAAKRVISAVNAWTSKLFPQFANLIIPIREQMLSYTPIEPLFPTSVSVNAVDCEYWQQAVDGSILIGGCGATDGQASIGTWEMQPTDRVQTAIEQVLPRLFPQFPSLSVTHRWAGLLDYTTDSCPIIDQVPDMPGVFLAAGFSGHGMPFGMRVGQLLAEAIKQDQMPEALKPYMLDRPTLKEWDIQYR